MGSKMKKAGAMTGVKPADGEAQAAIDAVKGAVETKTGKKYTEFKAVSYATQTVAGRNFFVKVNVGGSHLYLRIHQDFSRAYSLHSLQSGKTAEDPIVYF